jgi:hypothetical protein
LSDGIGFAEEVKKMRGMLKGCFLAAFLICDGLAFRSSRRAERAFPAKVSARVQRKGAIAAAENF